LKQPVTLIFDVGKTTKKALVFDERFNALEEKTVTFPEITDDDGFAAENLQMISAWVTEIFNEILNHSSWQLTHLNFAAYGASFVHLDSDGNVSLPLYNYLKPLPEECRKNFISLYNADNLLFKTTASPMIGMLNSGLQLFWLKNHKQKHFASIQTSLHLPQYFPFLITGKKYTEITSVGCHTMLWDFGAMTYHKWVTKENLIAFFPELHTAEFHADHYISGRKITVGIGVHDSSAALMPYLITMNERFMLLSTGTWNIAFNPFNHQPLSDDELSKDCLSYLTYDGKPVKASRIFLGHEHELQIEALGDFFKVEEHYYKNIAFDERLYLKLASGNDDKKAIHPIGMEGSGPLFAKPKLKTDFNGFNGYEEAYHQVLRHLAAWQKLSLDLADPRKEIKTVIVVGGFTKNPLFMEILKREISDRAFTVSDHPRASALGAAWLVHEKQSYSNASELLKISSY
jgi:L-fuculokinase